MALKYTKDGQTFTVKDASFVPIGGKVIDWGTPELNSSWGVTPSSSPTTPTPTTSPTVATGASPSGNWWNTLGISDADWNSPGMDAASKAANLNVYQRQQKTTPITASNGMSPQALTNAIANPAPAVSTAPVFTLTGGNLQQGTYNNENVKQLQTLLGITADGDFGPITKQAVIDFQKKNGLTADGIVGLATVAALNRTNTTTATGNASTGTTAPQGTTSTPVVQTSEQLRREAELARIEAMTAPTLPTTTPEELTAINTKNDLSNQIADVQGQQALLKEEMRQFTDTSGRELSQAGYEGGLSEKSKELQFKMDSLNIKETLLTTKLNNQNNLIAEIKNTQQTDYTNALNLYNSQFAKSLQLYSILDKNADEVTTNAKATLDVYSKIYLPIIQGGGTLTAIQQAKLNELETQAGLPLGITLASLQTMKPEETVQVKGVDDNGNYYEVIKRADGSLYTRNLKGVESPTNDTNNVPKTESERKDQALQAYSTAFVIGATLSDGTPILDSNGFITPVAWKQAITDYKGNRADFIKQYGYLLYQDKKGTVSSSYGLTPQEIKLING